MPLMESRWHVLIDRGPSRRDRAAAFAVGPTGVYALVFTDSVPDRQWLRGIRKHAEEVFAGLVFGRSQYVPHMLEVVLLMPHAADTAAHDPFVSVDEATMRRMLLGRENIVPTRWIREITATVTNRGNRFEWISADDAPTAETVVSEGLFGASELREDERGKVLGRPFQEWMTFLDPDQISLVNINFTGPARLSGPAGTGKTVVALHRMARFAKTYPGRLLFTSFVRTLPAYHESAFTRLAPQALDRTEFIGLHKWTTRFLTRRGVSYSLGDEDAYEDAFARAWTRARHVLGDIRDTDYQYWKDEVDRVIKGRGLETLDAYKEVTRSGREGVSLGPKQRENVWWLFYKPYRARLQERGIDDFNDVIRKAINELRDRPLDDTEDYALVVVDEVQDFTLMELKLVHQISGGSSDAQLLLVGDGQQQVYAGGWKLSDAGIPLPGGRGRVLKTNYRNREAVLRFAQRVEASNTVDDLDGGPGFVLRDSEVVLPGGKVVVKSVRRSEIDEELVRAINESGYSSSDAAVIVGGRRDALHYQHVLERAGLSPLPLDKYDGIQHDAIKVGTVHRSKGMDFAAVFHITEKPDVPLSELTGGARDRAELLARQSLVAMSRPRDFLWVAYLTD
ncbi:UvrD-helicase domain-containing protein [Nocardia huaxiensis]|uniref:UvrD-helicase domain-containing protein n=1 Tax=Nocardia huaxiensis TaxID=2755382 RepID=A0A7D7A2M5_9NOCA|nr:UvrD-helicase domain-containing protein [Nocardia huaxiensis]